MNIICRYYKPFLTSHCYILTGFTLYSICVKLLYTELPPIIKKNLPISSRLIWKIVVKQKWFRSCTVSIKRIHDLQDQGLHILGSDWPIFQSQETCPHHHHHHLHKQPGPTQVSRRGPTDRDPTRPCANSLVKATQSVQRTLKTSRFIWTSSALNGNPGTRPVITDIRKKGFHQRQSSEQRLTPFAPSFSFPAGFGRMSNTLPVKQCSIYYSLRFWWLGSCTLLSIYPRGHLLH